MKTIFSLILSLALAAALCLVLVTTGVLKLNGDSAATRLTPAIETVLSHSAEVLDALPRVGEDASHPVRQETSSELPVANQPSRSKSEVSNTHTGNAQSKADKRDLIHSKALGFLSAGTAKGGADIEDRFAMFLTGELGLDEKEAARLVRMSFWKNFVTLQHPWRAADKDEMRVAFAREKELKKAGFAARGLTLMANEMRETESRLQEMIKRLSDPAFGGKGL